MQEWTPVGEIASLRERPFVPNERSET
jgi:hypothetical protein